jgi:hypothetical protein
MFFQFVLSSFSSPRLHFEQCSGAFELEMLRQKRVGPVNAKTAKSPSSFALRHR